MAVSTEPGAMSHEEALEKYTGEYQQLQRELKEVDLLIQQTTAEVERLARRNAQAANRLRHTEASLDTVPREDIREAYTIALDSQQRLFTMRGQLEKLQSDQRNKDRYLDLLRRVLEMSDLVGHREPKTSDREESTQASIVRIIETQERERQRLSRRMHDGPAQALTNLILQAEIIERLFDTDVERARAELANLKTAVGSTFQKVRGFILDLRPMMLDDLGVVPTLRRYVESFSDNSGVITNLTVTGKERRWASHKEVTMFGLVKELLNNAHEHSHATSAQISVDIGDELIRVAVEDDGEDIEVEDALSSPEKDRLGLATMRERVEMLGGQIRFESGAGRGTRVGFELPIP